MKKLMMFAAAMTIVGGAYASACSPSEVTSPCDTPVWNFTASGKTANNNSDKGYKASESVKMKGYLVGNVVEKTTSTTTPGTALTYVDYNVVTVAGAAPYVAVDPEVILSKQTKVVQVPVDLVVPTNTIGATAYNVGVIITTSESVLTSNKTTGVVALRPDSVLSTVTKDVLVTRVDASSTITTGTGECCIESFMVILYDKVAKVNYLVTEEALIAKMTIFGKGFLADKASPGKSYTVESDVLWTIDAGTAEEDDYRLLQFVGFGKGKLEYSKGGTSGDCYPVTEIACAPSYTWPSWSGWFTGWMGVDTDSVDLACEGQCIAVAGGTWSAKYNAKMSAQIEALQYIVEE